MLTFLRLVYILWIGLRYRLAVIAAQREALFQAAQRIASK